MGRQNIYGHKTKKLEKNVIQSVYQMTQEAVFAKSTSVLKSAILIIIQPEGRKWQQSFYIRPCEDSV